MSAALLNQDFGSESEDDNFNPAPANDSDDDAAGDSDREVGKPTKPSGPQQRRRSSGQQSGNEEDDEALPRVNGRQGNIHGSSGRGEEDDDDAKGDHIGGVDREGDEDEEEEEQEQEEDEDEDEEEAVSVCPILCNLS